MIIAGLVSCSPGEPRGADAQPERPPLGNPPDPGPPPAHDGLEDSLRQATLRSTVHVGGIACGRSAGGSGFAVTPRLIATAAHTLVGLDQAIVSGTDGLSLTALPVAFDAVNDLALLDVGADVLEPLALGGADDGTIGALMGWEDEHTPEPTPFRIDRPLRVRITAVASSEQVERRSWLLAADVEDGYSGAALVDAEGEVVGIAYAATRRDSEVGYATRADELAALIAQGPDPDVIVPDC